MMKAALTAVEFTEKMLALYGRDLCMSDTENVVVAAKMRLEVDMECDQLALSYDRVADSMRFVFHWNEMPSQRVLDKIKRTFPNSLPA
jgi:hypothetical protein